MNISPEDFDNLSINPAILDEKKQQTSYKIKYVSRYVYQWALIEVNRTSIQRINFIDCMCNAGIYKDGDACTALEVINIFNDLAKRFPQKSFVVYLNDINYDRICIFKIVLDVLVKKEPNLYIRFANVDVNECLDSIASSPKLVRALFSYGNCTLLYVDPYNFGTVEIKKLHNILKNKYCELLFNLFTSDYVRNIGKDSGRIQKCLGGYRPATKEDFIEYIVRQLRVGHIKYIFSYSFHTMKNVELYQILFATPNLRGLEVLKETLWDVFNGNEFHRNDPSPLGNTEQMCMFTVEDKKIMKINEYALEAKQLICQAFQEKVVAYQTIEKMILEKTMLNANQIIRYVLKPLINDGLVKKCGKVSKSNYKGDYYQFL